MTLPTRRHLVLGAGALVTLTACGSPDPGPGADTASSGASGEDPPSGTLTISAIPDQDPEKLNRLYPALAAYLSQAAGVQVEYVPVTDYPAVVRAFEIGDVQMSWMGGLTGVQARSRVEGANAVAQRDIDADFHSLFIATTSSGLAPFTEVDGLTALAGHSLTFGSETSTSGRLMPQYFMGQAGLDLSQLAGQPGFSGSHDATIEAVASGSFEVGAVNEQVWTANEESGAIDTTDVDVLWRTPGYADYHWLARPDIDEQLGDGVSAKVVEAILALDAADPTQAEILDLFGAESFVPAENADYDQIEQVAGELGLLA